MTISMNVVAPILIVIRMIWSLSLPLKLFSFSYVSESETGVLRKCCDTKTYDPRVLACCQDNVLKQHGTCGVWERSERVVSRLFFISKTVHNCILELCKLKSLTLNCTNVNKTLITMFNLSFRIEQHTLLDPWYILQLIAVSECDWVYGMYRVSFNTSASCMLSKHLGTRSRHYN